MGEKDPATREQEFIVELRKEAAELKDCFTRYSFQAMSIAIGALVLILRFQTEHPVIGIAAILPVVLLLAVCSMGTHKYAAVNRLLGYELHLQRTSVLVPRVPTYWRAGWRNIGWEEAMRAWRVVAPTLVEHICIVKPQSRSGRKNWSERPWKHVLWRLRPDKVRRSVPPGQRWFEPASLIPEDAAYYAGGYLQTMLNGLYLVIVMALADLFATPMLVHMRLLSPNPDAHSVIIQETVAWGVFGVATSLAFVRWLQLNARRRLLESGVLSIHSCAIMWQAAVAAHFRALHRGDSDATQVDSFDGYTRRLGEEACHFLTHIGRLNRLLDGTDDDNTSSKNRACLSEQEKVPRAERLTLAVSAVVTTAFVVIGALYQPAGWWVALLNLVIGLGVAVPMGSRICDLQARWTARLWSSLAALNAAVAAQLVSWRLRVLILPDDISPRSVRWETTRGLALIVVGVAPFVRPMLSKVVAKVLGNKRARGGSVV